MSSSYLVDRSAFARWPRPEVASLLDPLSAAGLLAVCGAVELELLHSARSPSDATRIREGLRGFEWLPTPDEVWDRAAWIQSKLVVKGSWRAVSVTDLVIAAVAQCHQAVVLHYDHDFDLIAAVTSQPTQWVVPAGTVD